MLAGLIDSWKNRGLAPDQVPAGEGASFANGKGRKLYVAYQERLKVLNAADFGDLLLECIRLFRTQSEVLRQYQARFKYILVDEYQDTNVAQYLWLRLLGQSTGRDASATLPSWERLTRGAGRVRGGPRTQSRRLAPSPQPSLASGEGAGGHPLTGKAQSPPPALSKTSAASATTTSRSMAGAGRRSTISCASSTTFRARR